MRRFLLVVGLFGVSVVPAGAVTYELEDVGYNQAAQTWSVLPAPTISITITPTAVASGSFSFSASTGPLTTSGDVDDFVAFRVGSITLGPSGYGVLYSHLNVSLTFAADGSIASGSIDWLSPQNEFELSGDAASFGGTFSLSDSSYCGYNSNPVYACQLSGVLVDPPDPAPAPMPEPGSAVLLLLPVGAIGLARARLGRAKALLPSQVAQEVR